MINKYKILQGDVLHRLGELPSESVHCVCTSPPYWGLRDYGTEGQVGCEQTLDCLGWATGQKCGVCHVCVIVSVFREVRRVLRKDGTLWLNYGDCYATSPNGNKLPKSPFGGGDFKADKPFSTITGQMKPKDLCMVPARVALALQADGWWLRSEIIWAKGNPMPESVTDRPTSAHEKIYLLSKSERYYYDADAVRESAGNHWRPSQKNGKTQSGGTGLAPRHGLNGIDCTDTGRNLRNVWNLNTEPYPAAHFATYPTTIPKRAILAGTSEKGVCPCCGAGWRREVNRVVGVSKECPKTQSAHEARGGTGKPVGTIGKSGGGRTDGYSETIGWYPSCSCNNDDDVELEPIPATVLDPFLGSGTTVAVALSLGRRGIGIELNAEYVKLAEERIKPFAMQEVMTF